MGLPESDWAVLRAANPDVPSWPAVLGRIAELEAELLAAQEREKALREALERLLYNMQLILNKRPVRDWDETLAEAKAALAASPSEKPGSEEELAAWPRVNDGTYLKIPREDSDAD